LQASKRGLPQEVASKQANVVYHKKLQASKEGTTNAEKHDRREETDNKNVDNTLSTNRSRSLIYDATWFCTEVRSSNNGDR